MQISDPQLSYYTLKFVKSDGGGKTDMRYSTFASPQPVTSRVTNFLKKFVKVFEFHRLQLKCAVVSGR